MIFCVDDDSAIRDIEVYTLQLGFEQGRTFGFYQSGKNKSYNQRVFTFGNSFINKEFLNDFLE